MISVSDSVQSMEQYNKSIVSVEIRLWAKSKISNSIIGDTVASLLIKTLATSNFYENLF